MIYPQAIVYSLEALGYLAAAKPGRSIKVKELVRYLEIPEHYLGKVLTELVKKKFIASTRGPSGGFRLIQKTRKMTVYRILASIDGLTSLEDNCVMGLKNCTRESPCALHDLWQVFKKEAIQRIQDLTLAELSDIVMAKHHLKP